MISEKSLSSTVKLGYLALKWEINEIYDKITRVFNVKLVQVYSKPFKIEAKLIRSNIVSLSKYTVKKFFNKYKLNNPTS